MAIRVREAEVSMGLTDGEALTPMQMSRIVTAVVAEMQRLQQDERSRMQDTKLSGAGCGCQQQGAAAHAG